MTNYDYTPALSAELVRYEPGDVAGTPGELNLLRDGNLAFTCKTLELPDLGNKPDVSCIPEGDYALYARRVGGFAALYKRKFGHQFSLWIRGVPDRKFILVHIGNEIRPDAPPKGPHSQGCVLVGCKHGITETSDGDPYWAVWNSAKAYRELYQRLMTTIAPQGAHIPFVVRNAFEEADEALTADRSDL